MHSGVRRFVLIIFLALLAPLVAYLLWIPYIPKYKALNPKTTSLMERRAKQALKKGKKLKPKMYWKNLSEISPNLVHAVVLAEDDVFYQHSGFDLEQIKIAVKMNWKKKRYAYGGSTITQQLARTLFLSPSKTIWRKLKEALITFWLEKALTKKRILELYLNVIEWGDGVFGAEAASRHYYNKSAAELTPEEAVALSSILPSPRKWSPLRQTPFLSRRRANIEARMKSAGYIAAPEQKELDQTEMMDELIQQEEDKNQEKLEEEKPGPGELTPAVAE